MFIVINTVVKISSGEVIPMKENEKKEEMTVREAGRRGGEKTAETHGHEFYEEIGRKGGETTKEEYGPEFYKEIGKKGGETVRRLIEEGKKAEGK